MNLHRTLDDKQSGIQQAPKLENRSRPTSAARRSRYALFRPGAFVQRCGIFGSIVEEVEDENKETRVALDIGACLPSWAAPAAVSLQCSFHRHPYHGLQMHWGLGLHFRVANTSPLMRACEKGDMLLIRQILEAKRGGLNDRSVDQGLTPLFIAIRGEHYEAMEYLLQQGADPNLADDYQVTPLFAVLGLNPASHPVFEQLPPSWDQWLNAARLLVKHKALISETVRERNLPG
ncbi:hypothetical protein K491DRAFT_382811 [Lophiostoma macrostomum CBS 122681]|uniref:Uncharacterized protein n=1 Tax=Lophiostoma macrostomum CBS 122681 TaxID=1314788 RepID=A0A6A6TPG4_9PLEO|nr:hypothetical protein K491DRAFT_382811 [Lophiostoma macrostomum CBS 122681]